ncbi:MAG: hypothetical protein ACQERE_09910 [Pseudomonadota bacterium]
MKGRHALLLVSMVLVLNGCSLFQKEDDESPGSTTRTDCDWTPVRGVAELIRFEDNSAVMDFFPGEIRFRTDKGDRDWTPGDEFKVLLETPDHPECGEPRVRELSPVGPDA